MKVIETERLVLRHLSPDDAGFIVELLNEPAFLENIGDKGVRTDDDARRYIAEGPDASYRRFGFGLYLVELKDSGEPIGMCGLLKRDELDDIDIGFAFLEKFRSKGYAVEAASAVIDHAHGRLGLDRVVAITIPENSRSMKVLEKIGFSFERMARLSADGQDLKLFAKEYRK